MSVHSIEKAMQTVCHVEPVTNYHITLIRNNLGHYGAMIDIERQFELPVACYLEPQLEIPSPSLIAIRILLACGWVSIDIGNKPKF